MIDDEDSFLGGLSAKLAACGEGTGTEEEVVCRAAAEVVEALQTVQFVGRGAEEDGVAAQRIQQMAGQQQVAVGVGVGGDVVREVQRTVHVAAVALQLGVAPVPRVVAQPARFSVAGSKNQPFFLCLLHINSCCGVNPLMYHSRHKGTNNYLNSDKMKYYFC